MKLSIFTLLGNIGNTPDYWQYAWREALECYLELADEVVVVFGGENDYIKSDKAHEVRDNTFIRFIDQPWPYNFHWSEIAKHFNAGYEACTGDWVLKMDIDYFIHENQFETLRKYLEIGTAENHPALALNKFTIMNRDRAYTKVQAPFAINKKLMKDSVAFGKATDEPHNAWGYPIMKRGFDEEIGLPYGTLLKQARHTDINLWNYDNCFRDKERTAEHFLRFSQARIKAGFKPEWGTTKEEALQKFAVQAMSRLWKTDSNYQPLTENSHPKWIKDRVKNLTSEQFMFNNWNNFHGIL